MVDEVAVDKDEEDKVDDSVQLSFKLSFHGANARVGEDWCLNEVKRKCGQENFRIVVFSIIVLRNTKSDLCYY